MSLAVRMTSVSKTFGAFRALENVSIDVPSGAIHAIVGENGAGKTSLMRILFGAIRPDEGQIEVESKPVEFRGSADAAAAGIGMVSQHYGIIPALSCLENLMLGAEPGAYLNRQAATGKAQALADRMGFRFDWNAEASTLSPAGAQKLEILKLLWRNAKIMILDEPTAMLSPADSDALFASLTDLVAAGASVILVTHRLPEVMRYCKTVTVLRGGKRVAEAPVSTVIEADLIQYIVGEGSPAINAELGLSDARAEKPTPVGEPLLTLKSVTVAGRGARPALDQVGLTLRAGEVVGVAGVDGNGQQELLEAILGIVKLSGGEIAFSEIGSPSPSQRLKWGLRLIPEDRHEEAVLVPWSLELNSALGLQRLPLLADGPRVKRPERSRFAKQVAERFKTKHAGLNLPMGSLSGGNQQRFVAARALAEHPKVLVAFQPARGLDLGGAAAVYRAIRDECAKGMAALVIGFDLDELLAHSDRVVVMHHGQMKEPQPEHRRDRDRIGALMVGSE